MSNNTFLLLFTVQKKSFETFLCKKKSSGKVSLDIVFIKVAIA